MGSLILKAARFAGKAHRGTFRKWGRSRDPYIWHPMRVAGLVSLNFRATEEMVAAAWLHDVVEDCGESLEGLLAAGFPATVVELVEGLTNPGKKFPKLARAERKRMDREAVAAGPWEVRLIKLADRVDNLRDVVEGAAPEGFAEKYLGESRLLLGALAGTDLEMEGLLGGMLDAAEKKG
jgi:(p)ppGpp synthase/HD superfamily hydrolase